MKRLRELPCTWEPTWLGWSHDGTRIMHGHAQSAFTCIQDAITARVLCRVPANSWTLTGSWSHDDRLLAVVEKEQVAIRNTSTGRLIRRIVPSRAQPRIAVWNPVSEQIAITDESTVVFYDAATGEEIQRHSFDAPIHGAAWLSRSRLAVAAGDLHLVSTTRQTVTTWAGSGHGIVTVLGRMVVIGSDDGVVVRTRRRTVRRLAEDEMDIQALSISHDWELLAARSRLGTIGIWDTRTWTVVANRDLDGPDTFGTAAFSPTDRILAATSVDGVVLYRLPRHRTPPATVTYTTAKIALVGDSGVGKSTLAWRMTHGTYRSDLPPTHGENFWICKDLSLRRSDGTACEGVIWDFAGQPEYRLVHALFLGDIDVALLVFDPTLNAVTGVEYWLRAIGPPEKRCPTILVAGRVDRGTGVMTDEQLQEFAEQHGISGGFLATSAERGDGLVDLVQRIARLVKWENRDSTAASVTFNALRNHVLAVKRRPSRDAVIVTLKELRGALGAAGLSTTPDDILRTLPHLANHGIARLLRSRSGEQLVLLVPEILYNLAASIILEAMRNPKGLGSLDESKVLAGDYAFDELRGLASADQKILLDAAVMLFLERNVCFREILGGITYLVFPALIRLKKPAGEILDTEEGTMYLVSGAVENVYAALVVLLGYTNSFTRTNQWDSQAQYEMGDGQICGFRMLDHGEGQIELVLYFAKSAAARKKSLFQSLFEDFLLARKVTVRSFPPARCRTCGYLQARSEIVRRERQRNMYCSECGAEVELQVIHLQTPAPSPEPVQREQQVAENRTRFESAITQLKAYHRDIAPEADPPSCFICYAWGLPAQERWVRKTLAVDLRHAGIDVIVDTRLRAGADISEYIDRIESADFVVIVGTRQLLQKYKDKRRGAVVNAELRLINARIMGSRDENERVIPLLRDGDKHTSLPPQARTKSIIDFRIDDAYFQALFDLLLNLYRIPLDDAAAADLRELLSSTSVTGL